MSVQEIIAGLTQKTESKIVMLVMDGLGGLPRPGSDMTELEAAFTPNMDKLANRSMVGLMNPVGLGISPGSGPGHLGLFGYDPIEKLIGRGVLEAVGIGLQLTHKDLAARGNFCTVDQNGLITDRRAGRIPTEECERMVKLIEGIEIPDVELTVRAVKDYRFSLILTGEGLSPELNETDPQQTGVAPLEVKPLQDTEEAGRTAALVNEWINKVRERIKDQSPANMVTLRGWSKTPGLKRFEEVYKLKSLALAVYPMYKGLASLVGMDLEDGLNDLEDQIRALKARWNEYDFFFVHYKYTDSRGEDGDYDAKVKEIEKVDKILPNILDLNPDVLIITGDHSTPAALRSHSWHPVPTLIHAPATGRLNPDVKAFGESECLKGVLGQFRGVDLMPLATAYAGKQSKYGA
jgi:2,3-bisphosphoglycerate-independent phosphoglycerate mutase